MRRRALAAALACVILAGSGGTAARAVVEPGPGFEETLGAAFRDLLSRRDERRVPLSRILDLSERTFRGVPRAGRELGHLRELADRRFDSDDDLRRWGRLEASLESALAAENDPSPYSEATNSLTAGVVFWHMAQILYDESAPERRRAERSGLKPRATLEGEKRAWKAGCLFWLAGRQARGEPGAAGSQGRCESRFPASRYCQYYSSVELVVLTAHQLAALGRIAPDADLSVLDLNLSAYCADLERDADGGPLSLEGFRPSWTASQCVEKAVTTVLDPRWKSTGDLCPAEEKSDQDVRGLARTLRTGR